MAFMPFVTAGDPDLDATAAVLLALRDAQVDLIELGFPYSDPIADGPVIQASYTRSLQRGITVEKIFGMMQSLKTQQIPPVLAMVSFAILFRHGVAEFIRQAAAVGFSGLIIPDLPADECEETATLAKQAGLDLIPHNHRATHNSDSTGLFRLPLLHFRRWHDRRSAGTAGRAVHPAAFASLPLLPATGCRLWHQWSGSGGRTGRAC
jgi:tryptophan synthase alpha subunit